ncbi:MAG: hypothetical protein V3S55_09715 [Nitrospiraceae bacterium]
MPTEAQMKGMVLHEVRVSEETRTLARRPIAEQLDQLRAMRVRLMKKLARIEAELSGGNTKLEKMKRKLAHDRQYSNAPWEESANRWVAAEDKFQRKRRALVYDKSRTIEDMAEVNLRLANINTEKHDKEERTIVGVLTRIEELLKQLLASRKG